MELLNVLFRTVHQEVSLALRRDVTSTQRSQSEQRLGGWWGATWGRFRVAG